MLIKTNEGYLHAALVPQSTRCPSYGSWALKIYVNKT